MNDLPINITAHDIEVSFALRRFIEKKISRLSRFASDVLALRLCCAKKPAQMGYFPSVPGWLCRDVTSTPTRCTKTSTLQSIS